MSLGQLRMSIYPYIPDLAGNKLAGLTRFIADELKKEHITAPKNTCPR